MIISSCEGVNDDFCRFVLNNKQHLSFYDAVFAALFITLIVFWGYRYFKRIHEEVRKTKDVRTAFKVIGKSLAWLWVYVIVALSVFSVFAYLAIFYAAHNGEGLSTDPAVWGQAGDFFGGMLNPFLAFCSFMALLYTIRIQSEELRLTREELTKSSEAHRSSANSQGKQLTLQKQLEEFKAINSVYLNYIALAEEQFRADIGAIGSLFKIATETVPKYEMTALNLRVVVQGRLKLDPDGAKRAHFYSSNVMSAKAQFEKLAKLSSLMEDDFNLLLGSYADELSYKLFWSGMFHRSRALFEPSDMTNELLQNSLTDIYKNLRVTLSKPVNLEDNQEQR
jgi:hypothetical protein